MADKIIEVKGLSKKYDDLVAVDNLDLDLYKVVAQEAVSSNLTTHPICGIGGIGRRARLRI